MTLRECGPLGHVREVDEFVDRHAQLLDLVLERGYLLGNIVHPASGAGRFHGRAVSCSLLEKFRDLGVRTLTLPTALHTTKPSFCRSISVARITILTIVDMVSRVQHDRCSWPNCPPRSTGPGVFGKDRQGGSDPP